MSDNPPQSHTETITEKSYITALMQRTVSECLLVEAKFSQSSVQPLTSTVLKVMPSDGLFLLDDLFPQSSSLDPAAAGEFLLNAQFEGGSLSFTTEITTSEEKDGLRLWYARLPESIEYHQARDEHRVVVGALEIPIRLSLGEGVVLSGRLNDLASNGIGLYIAKTTGIKKDKVYRCTIQGGGSANFTVEIVPSYAKRVEGDLPVHLGATLHEMSRSEQQQWRRFVAEMERRMLRKQ